jgi:diketogulonate reductase-like aldo/keto reductase
VAVVSAALDAGFRSFDTAMAREWYDERAVARALNASGLPRAELFISTKVCSAEVPCKQSISDVCVGGA